MTSIQEKGHLAQKDLISKALTGHSSYKSDNGDYKDYLGRDKSRFFQPQNLSPKALEIDIAWFI